jgi:hypothetical protein
MRGRAIPSGGMTVLMLVLGSWTPGKAQAPLEPTEIAAQAQAATVQILSFGENDRRIGSGTGFVISADGLIVTSFHVIQRARALRIEMPDGEERADVLFLGGDAANDVALLRVPAKGLPVLRLGDGADPAVGQRVYTMGHPLGQTLTFSDGLVSALRTVSDVSLIQITAPISSGSSGGPVMDETGTVIGIATMVLRGGQNLNFAVPARHVQTLLDSGGDPRPFAASVLPRGERRGIAALGGRPLAPPSNRPAASGGGNGLPRPSDAWEAQVVQQIVRIETALTTDGVARRSHPVEIGALRNGQSDEVAIELEGGAPYAVIAVCDTDCRDLDLELYSPDGALVKEDRRVSDFPHVRFRPESNGAYRLRVIMSGCTAEPCRYGVATFVLR